VIPEGVHEDTLKALPTLRTPPNRHLLPWNPPRAPLGQVLALRNQTLVNRAIQKNDETMTNPMENVAKALIVLNVRIHITKLIQDSSLGIATLALNH
jgi:hypothetical protein